jgi:hypothetical protein
MAQARQDKGHALSTGTPLTCGQRSVNRLRATRSRYTEGGTRRRRDQFDELAFV